MTESGKPLSERVATHAVTTKRLRSLYWQLVNSNKTSLRKISPGDIRYLAPYIKHLKILTDKTNFSHNRTDQFKQMREIVQSFEYLLEHEVNDTMLLLCAQMFMVHLAVCEQLPSYLKSKNNPYTVICAISIYLAGTGTATQELLNVAKSLVSNIFSTSLTLAGEDEAQNATPVFELFFDKTWNAICGSQVTSAQGIVQDVWRVRPQLMHRRSSQTQQAELTAIPPDVTLT